MDDQPAVDEVQQPRPVILLIEDQASAAELFLEAADEAGLAADIDVIEPGLQSLTRLRAIAGGHAERPVLILLDLQPSAVATREILAQVRSEPATADLRVVLLTDAGRFEDDPAARQAHLPDEYLVKPFEWAQYAAMMDYLKDLITPTSA